MSQYARLKFIGKVESSGEKSTIRVFPEYCEGLLGVEGYSHLFIIYWMHLRDDEKHRRTLIVKPPRHEGAPLTGVFSTRSPSRPNPIGLTVVKLESVEGCTLTVSGLDALEETPIIDIKPYSPRGDAHPDACTPEWAMHGPPT